MNTKDVTHTALSVAIFTLCSWLAVPIGDLSITMQIFALCFLSAWLGPKKGLLTVVAYLLLGVVGVPVFSGFTGGISRLLSPTGGFLIGFLCAAPLIGWWTNRNRENTKFPRAYVWVGMLLGVLVCYVAGIVWFWTWLPQNDFLSVLQIVFFPFLLPDLCKITLAVWLYEKLHVRWKKDQIPQ